MNLHLPSSGSLIEALLNNLGNTVADADGGTLVAAVSETQLDQALDAMKRGDIEYVILEDGDAFLQAAGEGDGPYVVQFTPGSEQNLIDLRGGATAATVRDVFRSFLRGEVGWRIRYPWG
jgi:hypothetical protein